MKQERKCCSHPDRNFPKMKCGFPLPCPYHTVTVDLETGDVALPLDARLGKKTVRRLKEIADALKVKEK